MKNIQREISKTLPPNLPDELLAKGEPIFTAYGCAMLERDRGNDYVYTAVNLTTGKSKIISRQKNQLTTSGVEEMAEKIRMAKIAGAGRLEADKVFGQKLALQNCRELLTTIFNEILPRHGYAVRAEQISLAEHILGALDRRSVSLAEAEVGTGKTLAYLVATIIAKRGRLNGYWNMSFYTGTPHVDTADMPIVIATSSIALQKALMADYIPEVSRILLETGVIKTPITAVLRKGREHYVCERNLRGHLLFEHNKKMKAVLEELLKPNAAIDLAEIDGLSRHVRNIISVPSRCDENCPHRESCQYMRFRRHAQSPEIDIQVCNHNYFIADVLRRRDGQRPLIPNFQSVVIDESHKFLQAARSMYGLELSCETLPQIKDSVFDLKLKYDEAQKSAQKAARKLANESNRLFRRLLENARKYRVDEEAERFPADIDEEAHRHIRNIRDMTETLAELLTYEPVSSKGEGRRAQILWRLSQVRKQTTMLARHDEHIYWMDVSDSDMSLCAIPQDLDRQLYNDIWGKGIPTILTSGTLSAAGDFSHIKRSLGLGFLKSRITETSKPSPFDYRENALLYIPEDIPFPDNKSSKYIDAVTDRIEQLIRMSHGHAAVLFTSYNMMGLVYTKLQQRGVPFPLFRLDKGGLQEIQRFKESGNGVLFASGALWEGIDIPGDALSMLIIVKLPFAVPDSISEYEQTLYPDFHTYLDSVIIPEMLIKLKQGFGRLIRTECDTGAVAIFDSRVNKNGAYRERVIYALPQCRVTEDYAEVQRFFKAKKPHDYFEKHSHNH